MNLQSVESRDAPRPIGPYSQAVIAGDIIYCSGQIGLDPSSGNLVEGSVTDQAERAILNLKAVLEAAGSGLDRVVKTTIYLRDIDDFKAVNEVYERFFKASKPARSTVAVSGLPKGALVEIDAVAVVR